MSCRLRGDYNYFFSRVFNPVKTNSFVFFLERENQVYCAFREGVSPALEQ